MRLSKPCIRSEIHDDRQIDDDSQSTIDRSYLIAITLDQRIQSAQFDLARQSARYRIRRLCDGIGTTHAARAAPRGVYACLALANRCRCSNSAATNSTG